MDGGEWCDLSIGPSWHKYLCQIGLFFNSSCPRKFTIATTFQKKKLVPKIHIRYPYSPAVCTSLTMFANVFPLVAKIRILL